MRHAGILVGVLTVAWTGTALSQDAWPQFRGKLASGVAEGKGLPDRWSTTDNVAWKLDIPGKAWSSPIIWGGKVFVTTAVPDGEIKAAKKGLYIQALMGKVPPGEFRWLVYGIDLSSGKILWERQVHKGKAQGTIHIKNSPATETPVTDGERVYAYFGNVGLFCLDMGGKVLWTRTWPTYKTRFGWGPAASPVLHKSRIYIVNDNDEKSFLVAVDAKTGDEIWKVERNEKSNWATP